MEDDKLFKELFSNFDPELTPDYHFMDRLRRNMDSVEMIRRRDAELKKHNRQAVAIAAVVGFVIGALFTMAMPYIVQGLGSLFRAFPTSDAVRILSDNSSTIGWLMIAATSTLTALNTYDLSLSLLRRNHKA